MKDILLDTGVLIQIDRKRMKGADLVALGSDPAIPAIVLAELVAGAYGSKDSDSQKNRQLFIDWVLANIKVIAHDKSVALELGKLMDASKRSGNPRGDADLEVAATALATDRLLVTRDRKARFEELPGLDVLQLP